MAAKKAVTQIPKGMKWVLGLPKVNEGLWSRIARGFPSYGPLVYQRITASPQTPLNEVRKQIWQLRMEYWYRKVVYYPAVIHEAKNESMFLFDKIKQPTTWTPRDILTVLVFAMHCWGAFVVGEVLTKRQLVGYASADPEAHH